MTDRFGRMIDYMRISVTDLCNFRCIYCMEPEGVKKCEHREMLTLEGIAEAAAAAAACGIHKLRLTGGEPLVRKGIVELCRMLKSIDGVTELTITTNGSLLPELAAPLKDAGVDRLNISLDTLDAEKFRSITRCGTLDTVLRGLEAAERAGFVNTKIDTVLLGGVNTDEIAALAALTRTRAIGVRFIELMPMGVCAAMAPERFVSADCVLQTLPDLIPLAPEGVAERYRLPGAVGTVGLIRAMSDRFCASCNRIRLTADGKLKPCLHAEAEISVRGLHGEALREAVKGAIQAKPPHHLLNEQGKSDAGRAMYQIGG